MIIIYTGKPGSGKSTRTADTFLSLLQRNQAWFKKSGVKRLVYSNLKLSPTLEEKYKDFFAYWDDPVQLVKLRHCDVLWDEIAVHMDATQWQNLPLELKRWLQQHRKLGIDIYGNAQDFFQIDIAMRRLVSEVYILFKICGSRDISSTKPAPKFIWGLILSRQLSPESFDKPDIAKRKFLWFSLMFITRERISAFDTAQEIKSGKYPPLKHIERDCIDPNCEFTRTTHV